MKGLACFGAVILVVVATVVASIVNGWVLSTMWGWFVVPFFDLPQMSIPYAIGIAMLVRMLVNTTINYDTKEKDTSTKVGEWIGVILYPFLVLFMGWIVTLFL